MIMTEQTFVFDIDEFLAQAEKEAERSVGGRFCEAELMPGVWAYASGLGWHGQFFSALEHGSINNAVMAATAAGGSNPRQVMRFTQFANTSLTGKQFEKDKISYLHVGEFPWETWLERSFSGENKLDNKLYGRRIFVHVGGVRHPLFDEENNETWNDKTVWWDFNSNEPRLNDEGKVNAQYYDYVKAAFATKEELVEYMLANGVALEGVEPTKTYPVPEKWALGDEAWPECSNAIVADIAASKPLPAIFAEWKETGLTLDDIKKMQTIFTGE
jgi:hypothetical protein